MTFFCYLMDPMGDVLLAVHEDLGDDFFLHDLYNYDLYVSYFNIFSHKKICFGCLRNITFLGYGCDRDHGDPLMVKNSNF